MEKSLTTMVICKGFHSLKLWNIGVIMGDWGEKRKTRFEENFLPYMVQITVKFLQKGKRQGRFVVKEMRKEKRAHVMLYFVLSLA